MKEGQEKMRVGLFIRNRLCSEATSACLELGAVETQTVSVQLSIFYSCSQLHLSELLKDNYGVVLFN